MKKIDPISVAPGRMMAGDQEVRLTPIEHLIMWLLVARSPKPTSTDDLIYFCYSEKEEEPESAVKIIGQLLFRIRKKIKPLGWKIVAHWGVGYHLEPDEASNSK